MIWDFSKEQTWAMMEQRASVDARDAVLDYWPFQQREASPDMPQDLDHWARELTMRFLSESMGLPLWAIGSAVMEGVYLTVRNAYYLICRRQLEWHVCNRITQTHTLPRQTTPPVARPERPITYPLTGNGRYHANDGNSHS